MRHPCAGAAAVALTCPESGPLCASDAAWLPRSMAEYHSFAKHALFTRNLVFQTARYSIYLAVRIKGAYEAICGEKGSNHSHTFAGVGN